VHACSRGRSAGNALEVRRRELGVQVRALEHDDELSLLKNIAFSYQLAVPVSPCCPPTSRRLCVYGVMFPCSVGIAVCSPSECLNFQMLGPFVRSCGWSLFLISWFLRRLMETYFQRGTTQMDFRNEPESAYRCPTVPITVAKRSFVNLCGIAGFDRFRPRLRSPSEMPRRFSSRRIFGLNLWICTRRNASGPRDIFQERAHVSR